MELSFVISACTAFFYILLFIYFLFAYLFQVPGPALQLSNVTSKYTPADIIFSTLEICLRVLVTILLRYFLYRERPPCTSLDGHCLLP